MEENNPPTVVYRSNVHDVEFISFDEEMEFFFNKVKEYIAVNDKFKMGCTTLKSLCKLLNSARNDVVVAHYRHSGKDLPYEYTIDDVKRNQRIILFPASKSEQALSLACYVELNYPHIADEWWKSENAKNKKITKL